MALSGMPEHDRPQELQPFVFEARDALLRRLAHEPGDVSTAWIIHSAPDRNTRQQYRERHGANIVVLDVPAETCVERLRDREGEPWADYVARWWNDYEPELPGGR